MKPTITTLFLLLTTISFAQIPTYVPSNGLVGWWPFNGNANDESGNGNNGTVNGATLTADRFGVANKAYSFDGVNDYIDCGSNNSLEMDSSFSLSLWIKPSANPTGLWECFINKEGEYEIGIDGQGQLLFAIANNIPGWTEEITTLAPTLNYWTHFLITCDQVSIRIFLNGSISYTTVSSGLINDYIDHTNEDQLYFGWRSHFQINNLERDFNGSMDDIGIWNRALTDCEIHDLYTSQLGSSNTYSSESQLAIDSYTWPVNGQTYTQSGVYTDTLVNAAGCDSVITLNLELDFTGIQSHTNTSLQLYPNPVKDVMTLVGLKGDAVSFSVYSVDGKLIKSGQTSGEIQLEDLKKGNYILKIENQALPFVKL